MLNPVDRFFSEQPEPLKSTLGFLRGHILGFKPGITERASYGMPTYYLNGRRYCYLWIRKNEPKPYVGFIDGNKIQHAGLLQEKRSRMKIWLVDPEKDIPVEVLDELLDLAFGNALIK